MIYFLTSIALVLGYVLGAIFNFMAGPYSVPLLVLVLAFLLAYHLKREPS